MPSSIAAPPAKKVLDIRPIAGQNNFVPATAPEFPLEASPDMSNFFVGGGLLRKRPGNVKYGNNQAAVGGTAVYGLFSTQDISDSTYLYAASATGIKKYNPATQNWDTFTGTALNGGTNLYWWENSQNSVVFSQGVDQVQQIAFAGTSWATLNANCPPSRSGTRFDSRLVLGYTVESGNSAPYRIRRSVALDHTNWVGTGSGFTDLDEFPYAVRAIRKLGQFMVVYTAGSIWLTSKTLIAASPFQFDIKAADVGLYSPFTLQGWKDEHLFLGSDDFYIFNGAQPTQLGLPVRSVLFKSLNPGALLQNFAVSRFDTLEYIAFLCTSANVVPDTAWVYNKEYTCWYPWSVSGATIGFNHRLDNTQTWDGTPGTWDAQVGTWDSRILISQYPAMMTGHTDGYVRKWDTAYTSDDGAAIPCRWTSKDFSARDVDPSVNWLQVTLKKIVVDYVDQGSTFSLNFSYSTDGGATWSASDTLVCTTSGASSRFVSKATSRQVSGNRVRFKIENSTSTDIFAIAGFHVELELSNMPMYS